MLVVNIWPQYYWPGQTYIHKKQNKKRNPPKHHEQYTRWLTTSDMKLFCLQLWKGFELVKIIQKEVHPLSVLRFYVSGPQSFPAMLLEKQLLLPISMGNITRWFSNNLEFIILQWERLFRNRKHSRQLTTLNGQIHNNAGVNCVWTICNQSQQWSFSKTSSSIPFQLFLVPSTSDCWQYK